MKNKILFSLLIPVAFTFTNCSDKDFDLTNPSSIAVEQFYKTPQDAEQAVIAVYDGFNDVMFDQPGTGLDKLADDVWGSGHPFDNFSMNAQDPWVYSMWNYTYIAIYRANLALEKIPTITFTDATQKDRLIGETKFLRAFCYMYLVKSYGKVPLILNTPDMNNAADLSPKRAPLAEVWTQIEEDLKDAANKLPSAYDGANLGRATKGAALGYLGKARLIQDKFAEAAATFVSVMSLTDVNKTGTGKYGLLDKFTDNFHLVNHWTKEAVFQVNYTNKFAVANMWGGGGNNARGKFLQWGAGYPNLWAVHQFEDLDTMRLSESILGAYKIVNGDTIGNKHGYKKKPWSAFSEGDLFMGKYIDQDNPGNVYGTWDGTGPTEGVNSNLMRFSDILLMYAEAINETSGPVTAAVDALNQVRARAKLPLYPNYTFSATYAPVVGSSTKDDFRNAIKHERQVEFFYEQSRFYDLVRWSDCAKAFAAANAYETSVKGKSLVTGFVTGKNELCPIPQAEMSLNPSMKGDDNPGW